MNPRGTKKPSQKCKKLNGVLEALDAVFPREVCAGFLSMERKREDRTCSVGSAVILTGFSAGPRIFSPLKNLQNRYVTMKGLVSLKTDKIAAFFLDVGLDTITTSAI